MGEELHLERVFDAPSHLVWKAFTDPDQVAQWFAPSYGVFDEVVENELLVATELMEGEMADLFGTERMTMRIELHEEEGGRTRLVLTQGPYRADFTDNAREGWMSSFTKLDKLLAG